MSASDSAKRLWRGLLRCGIAALLAMQFGGRAAGQAEEPAGVDARYRKAIDDAVSEYEAGNFGESRALFGQAHALMPSARTLRGLGMVEFELRNYAASADYLTQALASQVRPLSGALRAETEQLYQRANLFIGRFTLVVEPSDARVEVDGEPASRDRAGVLVLVAGDHRLAVSAPGRVTAQRTLRVRGGERQTLEIALPLQTTVAPGAVSLAPVGPHSGASKTVADRDDEDGSVLASPWFWVAVGAVAAGAGVGIGLAASSYETREQDAYGGTTGAVLGGP